MANAPTHARIFLAVGGGADTIDVQETVEALVQITSPGVPTSGRPVTWVTYADGSRVWVNCARIVRIEPLK